LAASASRLWLFGRSQTFGTRKKEQNLAMRDMMQKWGLPDIIAVMVNISLLQLNSGLTINNFAN
jgi:hypothetical protein